MNESIELTYSVSFFGFPQPTGITSIAICVHILRLGCLITNQCLGPWIRRQIRSPARSVPSRKGFLHNGILPNTCGLSPPQSSVTNLTATDHKANEKQAEAKPHTQEPDAYMNSDEEDVKPEPSNRPPAKPNTNIKTNQDDPDRSSTQGDQ